MRIVLLLGPKSFVQINMCHLVLLSGPGYTIDKLGVPQPIEPESEGSSIAKGPGYFYQPYALIPGTSTEPMFGDEQAKLTEDEFAFICKVIGKIARRANR